MPYLILPYEEVSKIFNYNPETGVLTWAVTRANNATKGSIAGSIDGHGYRQIRINKKSYKAHRIAWLLHYKEFPKNEIDHINRIKDDNRILNLRDVTKTENMRNRTVLKSNTSGFTGVRFNKKDAMWTAKIGDIYLGNFKQFSDAVAARKSAEIKMGYTL